MPDDTTPPTELPFEEALDHLESLVDQLESDELTMEDALQAYERGVALADHCQNYLDEAEVRIEELASAE